MTKLFLQLISPWYSIFILNNPYDVNPCAYKHEWINNVCHILYVVLKSDFFCLSGPGRNNFRDTDLTFIHNRTMYKKRLKYVFLLFTNFEVSSSYIKLLSTNHTIGIILNCLFLDLFLSVWSHFEARSLSYVNINMRKMSRKHP